MLTDNELTIALLDLRAKIDHCGEGYVIRNTLRHKAMELAARFVDPGHEERPALPLRDGKAMSEDIDPRCGF